MAGRNASSGDFSLPFSNGKVKLPALCPWTIPEILPFLNSEKVISCLMRGPHEAKIGTKDLISGASGVGRDVGGLF